MIELEIKCDVALCMEMVRVLRDYGCVQGVDFDFAYRPIQDGWDVDGTSAYSCVEFTFWSPLGEQCSTILGLKYGAR